VSDIAKKEADKTDLQAQVDAQEISHEEFERMTTERDTLDKQKLDLETSESEESGRGWTLELKLSSKQDALEKEVKAFNALAAEVGLFPMTINADGVETELLELEIVHSNIDTMLQTGVDMKRVIKPEIADLRKRTTDKYRQVSDIKLKDQSEFEELVERSEATSSENENLEARRIDFTKIADDLSNVSIEAKQKNWCRSRCLHRPFPGILFLLYSQLVPKQS